MSKEELNKKYKEISEVYDVDFYIVKNIGEVVGDDFDAIESHVEEYAEMLAYYNSLIED